MYHGLGCHPIPRSLGHLSLFLSGRTFVKETSWDVPVLITNIKFVGWLPLLHHGSRCINQKQVITCIIWRSLILFWLSDSQIVRLDAGCNIFLHCWSIEVTITTHLITAINKSIIFLSITPENPYAWCLCLPFSPSICNQLKWLVILKDIYCKLSWESLSASSKMVSKLRSFILQFKNCFFKHSQLGSE